MVWPIPARPFEPNVSDVEDICLCRNAADSRVFVAPASRRLFSAPFLPNYRGRQAARCGRHVKCPLYIRDQRKDVNKDGTALGKRALKSWLEFIHNTR